LNDDFYYYSSVFKNLSAIAIVLIGMESNEIRVCIANIEKWAITHQKGLLIGGILGFSLTAAYLLSCRKKSVGPTGFNRANLNKERYVFDIITDGRTRKAVVESAGDCYGVSFDGRYLGSMSRDEARNMKWYTTDKELRPHLSYIAAQLSGAFSREGFPSLLKGAYPEIVSTEWRSSETLKVVIAEQTDLEVFSTFLKDEVQNLADFEGHLDLIVKKANNAYFIIIGVN
jgi:hypothetical protein